MPEKRTRGRLVESSSMIQARNDLLEALGAAIAEIGPEVALVPGFESPKQAALGDLASTAAMQLAKPLKQQPRELAARLIASLRAQSAVQRWVESIEIAGPGFINLRLKPAARQSVVAEMLAAGDDFGRVPATGERIIVEFVSANPTGPLHVGHGRQAALGDSICNLFETQGWAVTREFYYNDAGVQIETLTASVQARLRGLKPGDADWPAAAYNGDYIADIAADFAARKTVRADDREHDGVGRRRRRRRHPRSSPSPTCATSRTSTCRPSACTSTTTTSSRACTRPAASIRRCSAWSTPARPTRRTARCGCAPPTTATTRTA